MKVIVVIVAGVTSTSKILNQSLIAVIEFKNNSIPLGKRVAGKIDFEIDCIADLDIPDCI